IEDVRAQVARSIAARVIRKAELVDGSKVGVVFTLSRSQDDQFLYVVAGEIRAFLNTGYIPSPATATSPGSQGRGGNSPPTKLVIVGSSPVFVHRAMMLTRSKFLGRTVENLDRALLWEVGVYGLGGSAYDELALRDIVKKSVSNLMEPLVPPPGSVSVALLLSHTRAKLERMTPDEAHNEVTGMDEMAPPIFLIDIRSERQQREFGVIPGSISIDRNELEWKLDPRSRGRLGPAAVVDRFDVRVILISHDGKASSLAARSLQLIGLTSATDVVGGFLAWKAAGMPFEPWIRGAEPEYEDSLSSATERVHGPSGVEG
ncbi:hypothetical protein BJ322DRAFT_1010025, partial [Thelephora terrestris]